MSLTLTLCAPVPPHQAGVVVIWSFDFPGVWNLPSNESHRKVSGLLPSISHACIHSLQLQPAPMQEHAAANRRASRSLNEAMAAIAAARASEADGTTDPQAAAAAAAFGRPDSGANKPRERGQSRVNARGSVDLGPTETLGDSGTAPANDLKRPTSASSSQPGKRRGRQGSVQPSSVPPHPPQEWLRWQAQVGALVPLLLLLRCGLVLTHTHTHTCHGCTTEHGGHAGGLLGHSLAPTAGGCRQP